MTAGQYQVKEMSKEGLRKNRDHIEVGNAHEIIS